MRATIRSLLLSALLGGLFKAGVAAAFSSTVSQPAPTLALPLFNGQTFDLSAQHGKVVILHLWATWCPACKAEMPLLESLYRSKHPAGLDIVALSADRARDRSAAVKQMTAFSFPAGMLDDATTNGFGDPSILPVTTIIDREGVVRTIFTPEQDVTAESLKRAVEPLLAESPAAP